MVVVDANLSPPALDTLMREAGKHQVPVSADPTSVSLAERLKPHLGDLYMVTPDIPEAEVLCGRPLSNSRSEGTAAAKQLVSIGVQVAIVTLAELGVCYATPQVSGHIPAVKTKVIDRTGVGDNAFSVDEAVRLGASAAALTLRHEETVCPVLTLDCLYDALVI
jgi:pseudouridine kinase